MLPRSLYHIVFRWCSFDPSPPAAKLFTISLFMIVLHGDIDISFNLYFFTVEWAFRQAHLSLFQCYRFGIASKSPPPRLRHAGPPIWSSQGLRASRMPSQVRRSTQIYPQGTHHVHRLFETGAYSDLTITCGEDRYAVHKAIVCTRSPFFAAACNGMF